MPNLLFRQAIRDDLPAILAMIADDQLGQAREDASLPLDQRYLDAFAAIERDPNQMLIAVEQQGAVIGCFQITFIPGISRRGAWRGQIESARVARSKRGSGIGTAMFEWAIGECRRRGCSLVQLYTDKSRKDAHRFYERLGFKASHEGMKLSL
ncbi:MAG TPA: GNAT family N-acetyltransferase [Dongiaceae bacterium]|jgi:ribosomal protein S18 acetylase RimI-like enzyme|nr:GNAT family N-acetyltransferase [Dongiaceae bacterium]